MVQLRLPKPTSTHDISVIRDIVDVHISVYLGLDGPDRENILINNLSNHLRNHIIADKNPLRFEDIWKIKLKTRSESLYA